MKHRLLLLTLLAALTTCSACISSVDSVLMSYARCRTLVIGRCKPVYGLIGHGPTFGYVYNDCNPTGFLLIGSGPVYSGEQIRQYTPKWVGLDFPPLVPSQLTGTILVDTARGFAFFSLRLPTGEAYEFNGKRYFREASVSSGCGPCERALSP